MCDLITKHLTD